MKFLYLSLLFIVIGTSFITTASAQKKVPVYARTYKTAKEYLKKKQFTMARALFIEVKRQLNLDGTYGAIIDYQIGLCFEGERNYAAAIKHFTIYIKTPSIPKRWPSKASVRAKMRGYATIRNTTSPVAALAARKKAILAKYARANILLKRKAFFTAYSLLMEVRRVTKKLGIFEAFIDVKIGLCLFSMKRYRSSIRYFKMYNSAAFHKPEWPKRSFIKNYIKQVQAVLDKSKSASTYDPNSAKYAQIKIYNAKGFKLFRQYNYSGAAKAFLQVKNYKRKLKIYTHYIDYNIALCYDRLGKFRIAIRYYNKYLKAPIIKSTWPQIYIVRRRIADLKSELKRANVFNSNNSNNPPPDNGNPPDNKNPPPDNGGYGNETPTATGSIYSKWWFWPGAIVAGIVVIVVLSRLGGDTGTSEYKSSRSKTLLPGGMPSIGSGPGGGVNIFRF